MKSYKIYREDSVVYDFVVDDNISESLIGNKYVSFTITSKEELDIRIGDYIFAGNEKYELFEPIDLEESSGVFTYPLTFYWQGYKLNNVIITDEGATTFAYHGEVSDFMTLLIQSLNVDYPEFSLGKIEDGSILDLNFDNSNCMAALQTVCENADMEWDIVGTTINVKKRIGEETDYVFEYGKNKGSYSVKLSKVANASITTRMIGKGGTLNLPADYSSPDSPKRLNLGGEVLEKNVEKYGKITGVYTNENIYPRLINKTVLAVTVPDNIEEAGSWKIKLDIPFNLSEYYADNEVPLVKFQTGDLTGLEFEIVEDSWNDMEKTLSIITKEETDGYYIPNKDRQPRVGDFFVLLNIYMPQSYVEEATEELRKATQDELDRKCEPQYAPSLSLQKHYIKKKNISLHIGDGITVKIGKQRITTRIIGLTESSSRDEISVELGDQMLYTYDTKVNNTLEQIQTTLKQLISIEDIRRLFYNLINAWYPKWFNQKLHKDANVKFGSVQSDNISSENFTSGLLGVGHRLWNGVLEVSELIVRKTMHVFELIVQKISSVNGSMLTTPGGGIRISVVEELEDGYKCFFNNDEGTIPNPFIVGDQALHQVFTGNNIGRYWRLVTEVGDDYFVLSKTDCEEGSDVPKVEDEVIQFGNRTEKSRQKAILTTSYGQNAPYTAYYSNVNSYSLEGKEELREGNLEGIVDEDFGQLVGFGFYGKNVYLKGILRLMSGKTVEQAVGDVQNSLNNLQIGGVNILNGSTTGTGWDYGTHEGTEFSRSASATSETAYIYSPYIEIPGNTEIVVSFYAKHVGDLKSFDFHILSYNFTLLWDIIEQGYNSGTDWVYNEFKFTTPPEWGNGKRVRIRFDHNGTTDGSLGTIYVKDCQIEYGNKATTYTIPEADRNEITQKKIDELQIGTENLISWKMMLEWNKKNKDIAVYGMDGDGVYLGVEPTVLYNNYNGSNDITDPIFNLSFKQNTQYVLSIEWKLGGINSLSGLEFRVFYSDGTLDYVRLDAQQTSKTIQHLVTQQGKTIVKIGSTYYNAQTYRTKIYNISLIEGNKPIQGFPVATDDLPNNINLADGTKEVTAGPSTNNYSFKSLDVVKVKPNTAYYVSWENVQNLAGSPSSYTAILYDLNSSTNLSTNFNSKNGHIIITNNDFTEKSAYLLLYAGVGGAAANNQVKYTNVMLVEGRFPATAYSPSVNEQDKKIAEQDGKISTLTTSVSQIQADNNGIRQTVTETVAKVDAAVARETIVDLTDSRFDQSKYYPVTFWLTGALTTKSTRIELSVQFGNSGSPSWCTHSSKTFSLLCIWTTNGSGWGVIAVKRVIEAYSYAWTTAIPAGQIGQMTNSSNEYIYLRGGGKYIFRCTNNVVPELRENGYTSQNQTISVLDSVTAPRANLELAESEITQLKDSITLKVSKGEIINSINVSTEGVRIDASKLTISGQTLFKDSNGNSVSIFGTGDNVFTINGGVFNVDKYGKVNASSIEIAGTSVFGNMKIDGVNFLANDGYAIRFGSTKTKNRFEMYISETTGPMALQVFHNGAGGIQINHSTSSLSGDESIYTAGAALVIKEGTEDAIASAGPCRFYLRGGKMTIKNGTLELTGNMNVTGNIAISTGVISGSGFRPKVKYTSVAYTILKTDCIIIVNSTSSIALTMPSSCEDGQMFWIFAYNAKPTVKLPSGDTISNSGGNNVSAKWHLYIYDKTNKKWIYSYMNI